MTPPPAARPKASWPLLALAALAFLPGVGFFLGAAAVTWGLVTSRPRANLAVGLGAAGALLNLTAILVATFVLKDTPALREARETVTEQDLVKVVFALERFREDRGRYPGALQELVSPIPIGFVNIYDQTAGFGVPRVYQYRRAVDGSSYDLFSAGSDGEPGTADDLRPALPDSLRSRTGYKPVGQ